MQLKIHLARPSILSKLISRQTSIMSAAGGAVSPAKKAKTDGEGAGGGGGSTIEAELEKLR